MIISDLLQKYYSGTCSKEEKRTLYVYFKRNKDELNFYLNDEEWEKFCNSNSFSDQINENELRNKSSEILRLAESNEAKNRNIWLYSIAACFVLLLSASFYFSISKSKSSIAKGVAQVSSPPAKESGWTVYQNQTKKTTKIQLADKSFVFLYKESEVRFKIDSVNRKRIVQLDGEAVFNVAKDKMRPFVVYAGDVVTTALGTIFKVNSSDNKQNISVTLYEGKVLVNCPEKNKQKGIIKNYFLLPGHHLSFHKNTYDVQFVKLWKDNNEVSLSDFEIADIKQIRPLGLKEKDETVDFSNVPFEELFNYLELTHGVQIIDSSGYLSNMGFAGKIKKSESVLHVLQSVLSASKLQVRHENNVYVIK